MSNTVIKVATSLTPPHARQVTYSLFNGKFRAIAVCVDGHTYRSRPQRGGRFHADRFCAGLVEIDLADGNGWAKAD